MRLASPQSSTLAAGRQLRTLAGARSDTLRRLSTGLAVSRGRDDPAALISSEVLRQDRTKLDVAADNAVRARGVTSTAEAALANVNDKLLEMQGLINASEGSTRSAEERFANQRQMDVLLEDIDRELAGTEYAGRPLFNAPPAPPPPPFTFDRVGDIGAVAAAGSSAQVGDNYVINGSGRDIWNNADEFYYMRSDVVGDGQITARIDDITNTDQWAKAALVWRDNDTNPGAKAAYIIRRPDGRVALQWRENTNGPSGWAGFGPNVGDVPVYVRLTRAGNDFTAEQSTDNLNWTVIGSRTITMNTNATLGLGVTSHNDGTIATASFGEMFLDNPAAIPTADDYPDVDIPLMAGDPDTPAQVSSVFNLTGDLRSRNSFRTEGVNTRSLGTDTLKLADLHSSGELALTSGDGLARSSATVDAAIRDVARLRGRVGRFERFVIDPSQRQATGQEVRIASAISTVRDADVARETAELAKLDLLRQSGVDTRRVADEAQRRVLDLIA